MDSPEDEQAALRDPQSSESAAERSALRDALVEQMLRVAELDDLAPVFEPDAIRKAQQLTELIDGDGPGEGLKDRLVLGWWHWYRYQALPDGEDQPDIQASVAMVFACFAAGIDLRQLPGPLLPIVADQAAPTAVALSRQAVRSLDLDLLTVTIELWRRVLAVTPVNGPERAHRLVNLAVVLRCRFDTTGVMADMDESVTRWREAVEATAADSPEFAERLSHLMVALLVRHDGTESVDDLNEAIDLGRRIAAADPEQFVDWSMDMANLGTALQRRFRTSQDPADLDEAIRCHEQAIAATPDNHRGRARRMYHLGVAWRSRFERTVSPEDLDTAIGYLERAVVAADTDDPDRGEWQSELEEFREARAQIRALVDRATDPEADVRLQAFRADDEADLDEMIRLLRQTLADQAADRPDLAALLGSALLDRFSLTKSSTDLDDAVTSWAQAAAGTSADDAELPERLFQLGRVLRIRFGQTGAAADLDDAIDSMRRAVAAVPADDEDAARRLSGLAATLGDRAARTHAPSDLDELVRVCREVVATTPAGHARRPERLSDLGASLRMRFDWTGVLADIDEAVQVGREAVAAVPEDAHGRASLLHSLSVTLKHRFDRTGATVDIDDAVRLGRETVTATSADDPLLAERLSTLGDALRLRFDRTGSPADLDEAVQIGRDALAATPSDHPDRAERLGRLTAALGDRFNRTGDPADLDEAIRIGRTAIAATPASDSGLGASLLNLGVALGSRYERVGDLNDLNEAVRLLRKAVTSVSANHPDLAGYLSSLANALANRFDRTGDLRDLDEAAGAEQDALAATPADDPNLANRLSHLGLTLGTRFDITGDPHDLDEAVRLAQEAVAATPSGHPDRLRRLSNLGAALGARYHHAGALADLEEAVRVGREAVAATPADHPMLAPVTANLGLSLGTRYLAVGMEADRDEAIRALTNAVDVETVAPSIRIRAARTASMLASEAEPGLAASLLARAVNLLTEVAPRQLRRGDQQYALGGLSGLATDAAALALGDPTTPLDGRAGTALQLLETGRAVLYSQALALRDDVAGLPPHLADRFERLRGLLDRDGGADAAEYDRHELVSELSTVLSDIRALDDFGSFARPAAVVELLKQAQLGPIVVFNISTRRSDALLLTERGVTSLALPGISLRAVIDRINDFSRALHTARHGGIRRERAAAQHQMHETLQWLWDNAAGPVLDALGHKTACGDRGREPRVWWAPGGLMGMLPLHAAGYHSDLDDDPGKRTVMDRVVSSYTPTVSALRHARRPVQSPGAIGAGPALIVAMPSTPGQTYDDLDFVREEAHRVAVRVPGSVLLTEPDPTVGEQTGANADPGALPTLDNVRARLGQCPIAHFACHGTSDPDDPSNSRLLLHDKHAPLTVASLASVSLDHARLAFLSACETALATDTRLIDEAIHLASAFQLAGYPQVVGTLWSINDQAAADIADNFYAALGAGAGRAGTAAFALHDAVRAVRDRRTGLPSLWAAHIHVGA